MEDRIIRVTEQRNALKLEMVEKDEQLKVAKVRLRKMIRVLGEQEKQINRLKQQDSFKRPSGLPGNPRNRELENAYVSVEQSQSRLSQKVKELQRAKELLELRLNVVESKRALSSHEQRRRNHLNKRNHHHQQQQQQQRRQQQQQQQQNGQRQQGEGEVAHEQALVLIATLQQRLLEALREKRSIQARALQAFDDLQHKNDKGEEVDENEEGNVPARDFARSEIQRLHEDLERVHAELRSSESARLRLLGKTKAPTSPVRASRATAAKSHRSLEEKMKVYRVGGAHIL